VESGPAPPAPGNAANPVAQKQRIAKLARTFVYRLCYSPELMFVDTRLYSKSAGLIFGVLSLVCIDQVVSACSRPLTTLVDQSATAVNTQFESSQAGAAKLPAHRPPSSNIPHSVEVASASTLKHVSWEPQLVHQLAAETVQSFELDNLADQRAGYPWAPTSYSSVIVSDSSGRSPPRQS
jgi:hypothetical protein